MTKSPNNSTPITPSVGADELYELWKVEDEDPDNTGFSDAVSRLPAVDQKAIRRVFERLVVDDETGDWIDSLEPVGNPKVWFRGKAEYVNKVMWVLFTGKAVPAGKAAVRVDGHLHSVHPAHLYIAPRGVATSIGMLRRQAKALDAKRILMKYGDGLTEEQIDAELGIA